MCTSIHLIYLFNFLRVQMYTSLTSPSPVAFTRTEEIRRCCLCHLLPYFISCEASRSTSSIVDFSRLDKLPKQERMFKSLLLESSFYSFYFRAGSITHSHNNDQQASLGMYNRYVFVKLQLLDSNRTKRNH